MKQTYLPGLLVLLPGLLTGCNGQVKTNQHPPSADNKKLVGGGCEGCDIMYTGMPATINPVDTSIAWKEKRQKLLVTGTVYKPDGKTPAPDVVI